MDSNQFNSYTGGQNPDNQGIFTGQQNPYSNQQNPYMGVPSQQPAPNPYEQQATPNPYIDNQQYVYTEPWMNGNANNKTVFQGNDFGQQPYYQGQMQNSYIYQQPGQLPKNNGMIGFAITGMICGILSIISCCFSIVGILIAAVGLVFSIIALAKKYDGRGMALAGVICSAIGLCMSLIMTIAIYMDV
ncbi:MAG: DUF4190 domain-containing protein [Lachnospiraceae bacterium]